MPDTMTMQSSSVLPATTYLKNYQVPPYLIDDIELTIDLHEEMTTVSALMHIRKNPASQDKTETLILNGENQTLVSIVLNGDAVPSSNYVLTDKLLTLKKVPDSFTLEIKTSTRPQDNTELSGLYRSGKTYCTQCEAEGFRRITYFLDRPDVLTRYTTMITAETEKYPILLSNGNLISAGKLENGRHFAKWEDPFKKPCYLFALVAGDFDLLEDKFVTQSQREVTIRIYVEKGYGDQSQHAMHCIKEAMRWDEVTYGREYDLDIFMIVAIGDFNMGAMENKGLNIFNTKYILAKPETATDTDYMHILSVIGHEYFHNWSGNRVTCRDWFQLSLKEGLTIFRDQGFSEDTLSPSVMRIHEVNDLREAQFPEDAGPLAHPVRPDSYIEINNFYTATVYNKGAEVLRMMQTILGKQLFRKGMDLYFERYDGQAVTIEDFVTTMEEVANIKLDQFRLWYSQAGTPVLDVKANYDAKHQTYTLTFAQTCPPTPNQPTKLPFDIPVRLGLLDQQGKALSLQNGSEPAVLEKVIRITEATQQVQFNEIPTRPIPSFLRYFSAPIKLQFSYSQEELSFLMKHDKDPFNRWEAGQKYFLNVLLDLIRQYQEDQSLHLPADVIGLVKSILQSDVSDHFLKAEMLILPSENYIGEQMETVDVDAVHAAREYMLCELAMQLEPLFLSVYEQCQEKTGIYVFNTEAIGKRQLKNRCLSYLLLLEEHAQLGMQQFTAGLNVNMTDTLAALNGLTNLDVRERDEALSLFYQRWKADPLVVDKWFAIQATNKLPDALNHVKHLMQHEAFDIKNPNKVYSLIGAFGVRNPFHFHRKDGEGYRFLREVVQTLDKLNAHVSARMVKPLTNWKRYDKERQQLMRKQLEVLLQDKQLSNDLYELVTKSIE